MNTLYPKKTNTMLEEHYNKIKLKQELISRGYAADEINDELLNEAMPGWLKGAGMAAGMAAGLGSPKAAASPSMIAPPSQSAEYQTNDSIIRSIEAKHPTLSSMKQALDMQISKGSTNLKPLSDQIKNLLEKNPGVDKPLPSFNSVGERIEYMRNNPAVRTAIKLKEMAAEELANAGYKADQEKQPEPQERYQ